MLIDAARDNKPRRVVIDTNVYVSGLIRPHGLAYEVLAAWQDTRFEVVIAVEQIAEVIDVLRLPKFASRYGIGDTEVAAIVRRIESSANFVWGLNPSPVAVRDPDDTIILSIALTGDADSLVTGNDDLLVLANLPQVQPLRILTVSRFLQLIGN